MGEKERKIGREETDGERRKRKRGERKRDKREGRSAIHEDDEIQRRRRIRDKGGEEERYIREKKEIQKGGWREDIEKNNR